MKKIFNYLVILAAMVVIFGASQAQAWETKRIICKNPEAQKIMDQIYDMFVKDTSPATYKAAIPLIEKATVLEPDNDQIWVELSGDYWAIGDSLPKDTDVQKKARKAWFDKGIAAAEKALAIRDTAGANFWWACNTGAQGEMVGIMSSIPKFPKLKSHTNRANQLDPNYLHGASARFWSEVIARIPDIAVKAAGMKPDDAFTDIQAQVKRDPTYLDNYNYLARYMMRLKKKDEALKYLEMVLKADPKKASDPAIVSLNVDAVKTAKSLWKKYTGKDYPAK
jgi:tetratricopeptide (TPR) repeat protein